MNGYNDDNSIETNKKDKTSKKSPSSLTSLQERTSKENQRPNQQSLI
jgi:hypothetical protein